MENNVSMFIDENLDGIEVIQLKRLADFLGDYHTAKAINLSNNSCAFHDACSPSRVV